MEQQTTSSLSAEGTQQSYVQLLLDPAVEGVPGDQPAAADSQAQSMEATGAETDSAQDAATTTSAGTDAQPEATSEGKAEGKAEKPEKPEKPEGASTLEELIQEFAKETGLDPNDPGQRKTLKRLADKELFIRKLQSDNEALRKGAAKPATEEGALLTDFEKQVMAQGGDKKPAEGQPEVKATEPPVRTEPGAPAAEPVKYGDIGDDWKAPEDSLAALNEAWAENDLRKVHEIEVARLKRNFDSMIAPPLLTYINQVLDQRLRGLVEKDLGDVVPEVRRAAQERRIAESRDFAIDQLRKAGAEDIDKLFVADDGPPIKFGDQEFPNTPLNRVLAKHPEIMQIEAKHPDPATAQRMTFISRYKLAYQIWKQGVAGLPAAAAKKLVEAGAEMSERQAADRARQTINSGSGASGLGERSRSRSYVQDLNQLPGEISFSSIFD